MNRSLSRRQLLAASAGLAFSACRPNKGAGFSGYALVANQGDQSISAVDLTAFQLIKTIAMGASPTAVIATANSAAGHLAYVLTPASGSIHLIDANLARAASQRLSDQLHEMRLTPDGQSLLALAGPARELLQANPSTLRVERRHKFQFEPTSIDISSAGYAAIVCGRQGQIVLLQLSTGQRTQANLPHPLGSVSFRADGKLLLVANLQNRSILTLDVPTLRIVVELPLAMQPEHLCFNADQGQLFVSGSGMDGVAVVFPYQYEVDETLLAGHAPGPMACSENPPYLFVASTGGPSVCVLNIDTRKELGLVEVGSNPSFITTTPDSHYALILNQASGDMAIIHIPAIRTTSTANRLKTGTALFTMLNVGSRPVHAAVVRRRA